MKNNVLENKPLRSQPTRDRILEAARLIFGRDGYDHATIRGIAAEANINPAMVMRYYRNKETLFAAVTDFKLNMSAYAGVPKSRLGEALVRRVLENWESPESGASRRAILLTAMTNDAARVKFIGQYENQYAELLKRFGPSKQLASVTALIGSQVIGLLVARYVLRVPEIASQSNEYLIREVGRTVQGYMRKLTEPRLGSLGASKNSVYQNQDPTK
jgi:AcrR family transcriptional regulator